MAFDLPPEKARAHLLAKVKSTTKSVKEMTEKLERLQWVEGAADRKADGEKKQAEARAAKIERRAERRAAAEKVAILEALKADAVAKAKKPPPKATLADAAGLTDE